MAKSSGTPANFLRASGSLPFNLARPAERVIAFRNDPGMAETLDQEGRAD